MSKDSAESAAELLPIWEHNECYCAPCDEYHYSVHVAGSDRLQCPSCMEMTAQPLCYKELELGHGLCLRFTASRDSDGWTRSVMLVDKKHNQVASIAYAASLVTCDRLIDDVRSFGPLVLGALIGDLLRRSERNPKAKSKKKKGCS